MVTIIAFAKTDVFSLYLGEVSSGGSKSSGSSSAGGGLAAGSTRSVTHNSRFTRSSSAWVLDAAFGVVTSAFCMFNVTKVEVN